MPKKIGLRTTHEEADLFVCQHVFLAVSNGAKCVKVVSDDTDVFAILLHFFHLLQPKVKIFMEAKKEEWKVIDIGKTAA